MSISTNLFEALTEAELIRKELGLGLHKSTVKAIGDGKDQLGVFFCLVLQQVDTNVSTSEIGSVTRFKDIAKIHRGENRVNKAGYATQRGDGWERFFNAIFEQIPALAMLGWAGALEALEGKTINVWYTRSKQGYIGVHFSEAAYRYAVENGAIGADEDTAVDGKTLNEDCPF